MIDKEVESLILEETKREKEYINLIPSENYASQDILNATGSVFMNKYAEGYPHKRYYPGTEVVDQLELLAIERAKKLFNCQFANVQALSGSMANEEIYFALLQPGDHILSMNLIDGGHLSHGSKVSFAGKYFQIDHYYVDKVSELLDYDAIRELALKIKPKLIIAGASNYSRIIDWKKFKEIAKEAEAYLLADISHISALVVTGLHPSPFPYADVVMTTMQKQIRGPRGAIILSNDPIIAKKIDSAVFPGMQGGPQENIIAAKAVAFYEASLPSFKTYCENVIKNNKALCQVFLDHHYHVIGNGTDNHLFCVNVYQKCNKTGDVVEHWLEQAHILANMNTVPYDENKPMHPSGIRMGSPAMTTRNLNEQEFKQIGEWIIQIIDSNGDEQVISKVKDQVLSLLKKHPIY